MYIKHWSICISWIVSLATLCTACHNDEKSNVPDYPVNLKIQITSQYNTFIPDGAIHTLTFTKAEHRDMALGYGGVLVWTNLTPEYCAADMTCPRCMQPQLPVEVDGMYAVCPICGEEYDLSQYAFPTKGIADQALKRYGVTVGHDATGTVLYVRN